MFAGITSAVTISEWNLTTDGSAINVNTDVTAGDFNLGSGVDFDATTPFDEKGARVENWPTADSVDTTKYFQVTIAPQTGNTLTISDVNFDYSASAQGPASFQLQYSTATSFASPTTLTTKIDVDNVDTAETSSNSGLSIQVNSGETLTLRWFGYDFNGVTN